MIWFLGCVSEFSSVVSFYLAMSKQINNLLFIWCKFLTLTPKKKVKIKFAKNIHSLHLKGQNWLKFNFFLVLIPVISINTFFINSIVRVIICKLFQNKILSSLQTSFYKPVVRDLYFLSEYQICKNYPFLGSNAGYNRWF